MSQYYSLVTQGGFAAEANARTLGKLVNLAEFAVGDSNGSEYELTGEETSLQNERYRGVINEIIFDPEYPNQFTVEGVVPQSIGNFTIREAAIYTDEGILYGIAKLPPSYKTTEVSGATSELKVRVIFGSSNSENIALTIDPSITFATKDELNRLDTTALPIPDVQLCTPGGFVTSLHDGKFGKGEISVERTSIATMFDVEGRLLEFESHEPRYTPATGLLVLPPCTNNVPFSTVDEHLNWDLESQNVLTLESSTKRVNGKEGAVLVTNNDTESRRIHNSSVSPIQYKANTKVTASCLVKPNNAGGVQIRFSGDSDQPKGELAFNIETLEPVNFVEDSTIESYKVTKCAYGWSRVEVVFNDSVDVTDLVCEFYSYAISGEANSSMYIDYMQFESFPIATPPIVTSSTAVTCSGDKVTFPWKNNKRFDQFTIKADVSLITKELMFTGGESERRHIFNVDAHEFDSLFLSPEDNQLQMLAGNDSSEVASSTIETKTEFTAIARKSKNGDLSTFVDGELGSVTGLATMHSEPSDNALISLGSKQDSGYLCGYIKSFEIYSTSLTDNHCKRLRKV